MSRKRARAPQPRSAPQASPEAEAAELDSELAEELGGSGAGGALVLASKKAKARRRRAAAARRLLTPSQRSEAAPSAEAPRRLAKGEQKKLRKVEARARLAKSARVAHRPQEAKRARAARAGLLSTLSAHSLSAAQLALLRPASALGQRETAKQGLARELRLERAGLPLPADSRLHRRERAPAAAEADESEEEEEAEAEPPPAPVPAPDPPDALAALAARALGTKARKPDRQSLKRHKVEGCQEAEGQEAEGAAAAAAATAQRASQGSLRPLARALRAEVTGEADAAHSPYAPPPPPPPLSALPRRLVVRPRRPPGVQESRLKLPILAMEQEIMEAIGEHDVVVLCGATGCGKTTQLPQFLYEAGYGSPGAAAEGRAGAVCITQPRRVAVTSTAARVAHELGCALGGPQVGYAVRHDARDAGGACALRFVTDGVLLREAGGDLLLSRYSAVVVDEAHERGVNTDVLLGLLSRVVRLRAARWAAGEGVGRLKLVVMSATLRTDDFVANTRLFPSPPPLLHVPARQFPVTLHFARRTAEEGGRLAAAAAKVAAIHRRLPPGGVLVFLTGQREVKSLCAKLAQLFNGAAPDGAWEGPGEEEEAELGGEGDDWPDEDDPGRSEPESDDDGGDEEQTQQLGGDSVPAPELAAAAAADAADFAAAAAAADARDASAPLPPLHILPLYAMLPPAAQARVFAPPPPGARLCVVATNVAETSLTIPGIRYVVDCGRAKGRVFAAPGAGGGCGGGLSRFELAWVSQASAAQRAGRAGRTGPGHAYRLYSSAHYVNSMPPHEPPAILGAPLEGVVLQLRAMGIDRPGSFPFPTPPERAAVEAAEAALARLGALAPAGAGLTQLGADMAALPVAPRAARFLLAAAGETRASRLLRGACAVAAALSLESPFLQDVPGAQQAQPQAPQAQAQALHRGGAAGEAAAAEEREAWEARGRGAAAALHAPFLHPRSDALSAAAALLAFERCEATSAGGGAAMAAAHGLHCKTLREASALRGQLERALRRSLPALGGGEDGPGSHSGVAADEATAAFRGGDELALRRALAAGWADRVARRVRPAEEARGAGRAGRAVRYRPCLSATQAAEAEAGAGGAAYVFLHPRSALRAAAPEWVVYTELLATGARPYMMGASEIDPAWLSAACPALTAVQAAARPDPPPEYDPGRDEVVGWHDARYGPPDWPLPPLRLRTADAEEAAAAFAAALLAGRVLAPMAELGERLAAPASAAARPEQRAQRRVGELVHALARRGLASRRALAAAWRAEPRYLLPELSAWMRAGQAHALERLWPRLLAAAEAAPTAPKRPKGQKRQAA